MHVRRQPVEEESNHPVDVIGVYEVVVVENYGQVAREVGELVEKGARQYSDCRRRSWRMQGGENTLPDPLLDGLEGSHQVGEKTRGVVVTLVERQPSDRSLINRAIFQPLDQQRGLAEARRSGDQRQLAIGLSLEPLGQPRACDQVRTDLGGSQLGRHERVGSKWHLELTSGAYFTSDRPLLTIPGD